MNKKIITILLLIITCLSFLFAESNSSVKVAIDIDSAYQSIITHNSPNDYILNINDLTSKVDLTEPFEMQKDNGVDFTYYLFSNDIDFLNEVTIDTVFYPFKSSSGIVIPYRVWCDCPSNDSHLVGVANSSEAFNYSQTPINSSVSVKNYNKHTIINTNLMYSYIHFFVYVPSQYVDRASYGKYIATIQVILNCNE